MQDSLGTQEGQPESPGPQGPVRSPKKQEEDPWRLSVATQSLIRAARIPVASQADKQAAFLAVVGEGWSTTRGCEEAGIATARVYEWAQANKAFSDAWNAAKRQGADRAKDQLRAMSRGAKGQVAAAFGAAKLAGLVFEPGRKTPGVPGVDDEVPTGDEGLRLLTDAELDALGKVAERREGGNP